MTPDIRRGPPRRGHRRTVPSDIGYVDWPAIFAGTALAVALSFVLLTFGSAIGLSVTSFEAGEGVSLRWLGIASGIWFLWVAVTCFAAGGYLAGRMRRPVPGSSVDEVEVRDGANGLVVWAMGALVGAMLATSGVTGVVGAAGNAAGAAAQTASEAVEGDMGYLGWRLLRGDGGDAAAVLTRNLGDGEIPPRIATTRRRWWPSAPGRRPRRPVRRSTPRSPRRGSSTPRPSMPRSRPAWPARSPPSSSRRR